MKNEPEDYSIEDLKRDKTEPWDGIRNYQVRNMIRDDMSVGDLAFFYHSNCKPPCIVGLMEVTRISLVDPTQFDVNSKYYDPKSKKDNPRWDCVEVKYLNTFNKQITLNELKEIYQENQLSVVRRGNRLSIMPVDNIIAKDLLKKLQHAS